MPVILESGFVASGVPVHGPADAQLDADLARLVVFPPVGALRYLRMGSRRWAVGLDRDGGTAWRFGTDADADRLVHPAWLWTKPEVFAPDAAPGVPVAPVMPLRELIRQSTPLFGTVRATCGCLAAVIAGLRRRRRPVALVVPVEDPEVSRPASVAFLLALLTTLPPAWRRRLRVSTFEPDAAPEAWDFVIASSGPRGFSAVPTDVTPAVDDDLVATYVLDRLLARQPEAVEAAAYLNGPGEDGWGEGVKAQLRSGVPGFTTVDAAQIDDDPESAVLAICRRLQAGSAIRGPVAAELALVTTRTGDTRPWRILRQRTEQSREQAVRALLPHLDPGTVSAAVLRLPGTLERVGGAAADWGAFLVRCLAETPSSEVASEALATLERQVVGPEDALDPAGQAALWEEAVLALCHRADPESAITALLSPVSDRMIATGAGEIVVHGFLALPAAHRTSNVMRSLVDRIATGPAPDLVMLAMFRGFTLDLAGAEGGEGRARSAGRAVLQHWARLRSDPDAPALERDHLLMHVRGTAHAADWIEIVGQVVSYDRMKAMLLPVIAEDAEASRLWLAAEEARFGRRGTGPRARLLDVGAFLPEAGAALQPLALDLLSEILPNVTFPDAALSTLAAGFAELDDASPVWMWIAITAGSNGAFAEGTVDGTVLAFCEAPPPAGAERDLALRCMVPLARAGGWSTMDQGRWIARLALAAVPDGSGLNEALAERYARGLSQREDGAARFATITRELLALPEDHPARTLLLGRLIPHAWEGEIPRSYRDAVEMGEGMTPEDLAAWREALRGRS